jgi:hypothetical protein
MNRADPKHERILQVANNLLFYTVLLALCPFVTFLASQYGYLDRELPLYSDSTTETSFCKKNLCDAGIYSVTLGIPTKDHRVYFSGLLAIIALNIVRSLPTWQSVRPFN